MNVADRSRGSLALLFGCAALALVTPSCGDDDDDVGGTGGKGTGGKGATTGGFPGTTGGASTVTGGKSGTGGAAGGTAGKGGGGGVTMGGTAGGGAGGMPDGGIDGMPDGGIGGVPEGTGGTSTGGASTGGTSTGGASTGGASTGGTSTGGTSTGGTATGGTATGGTATGGMGGDNAGGDNAGGDNAGGDGGSGPVVPCVATVTGTLLHTFDPGTSLAGWQAGPAGPLTDPSSISRNAGDGHSCAGALQLTAPFTAYSAAEADRGEVRISNRVWSGTTALHVWLKVLDPGTGNLNHLKAVQLFLQTGNFASQRYPYMDASMFADFGWHEVVIPYAATTGTGAQPAIVPEDIDNFGVWLIPHEVAPTAGPAAPVATSILVDDIWVE